MKFVCKMFLILAGVALYSTETESVNRIANATIASKGQFPYMVSLQRLGDQQSQPTRGHSCGGALVSHRTVIITAFCLYTYNYASGVLKHFNNYTASGGAFNISFENWTVKTFRKEKPAKMVAENDSNLELINQAEFRVFAGSNLLNDDSSADFVRPILSLTVHPNFTGLPTLINNIAVIIVANEFPRGVVTPLALPATNFNPAEFTQCTVAGWGSVDQSDSISVELRFATKYVNDPNICTTVYNTQPGTKYILSTMICAVSSDPRSSNCYGDLGNPLVCGKTFTGILSSLDNCTVSSLPQVYTRISNYTTWIRSVSGAPSLIKPGILALLLYSFIK